ncbi:MAG: hypothetical protein ACTHMG_12670 [Sphingomonas sp.]
MKRLALLLLLVGAMLGLAAQAPARVLAPPLTAQAAAAMAAMPDCMKQMNKADRQKPCNCSRADCIAVMLGGASFATAADPAAKLALLTTSSLGPVAARTTPLIGRNLVPEPEPPARLI